MKKIISFYLIAVFLLVSFGSVVAAEPVADGASSNESIALLNDLNIFQGIAQSDAQNTMTRAEFAEVVARVMGYTDSDAAPKRIFTDVPADHEAAASIQYLYDRNIMRGYGGAEFKPDSQITVEEAVKVAVSVIGYSQKAEWDGGWSAGYYSAARLNGLLGGVNDNREAPLTIADAAALMQNVLECDTTLTITGYRDGEPIVEKLKGEMYMENVLGIHLYSGVVEGYGYTSLYGGDNEYGDTCEIGGEKFNLGNIDIESYLGIKVEAYYTLDKNNDGTLLHIAVSKDNRIVCIEADDIAPSSTRSVFRYFDDDDREKTLNISSNALYIYNGKKLNAVADADLIPDSGSVTLISNDRDSLYDVVIIKDYITVVVEKVLAADTAINLKYDKGYLEFSEGSGIKASYYTDGAKTEFSSISAGSVLSIGFSKNLSGDKLADVLISNNQVTGSAKSISGSDNEKKVVLNDDTEYSLTKEYMNRIKENQQSTYLPKLGEEGIFYIDYFGKLAAYTVSVASKNYAYVIASSYEELNEKAMLKLFTKDGIIDIYEVNDKFKLNGKPVKADVLKDELVKTGENGTVNQLIICNINDDNKITDIKTAEDKTSTEYYNAAEDEFVLGAYISGNLRFYKNMGFDKPYCFVDNKSLQFMIPEDKSNEKEYSVASKLSSTDVTLRGPLYIYDTGLSGSIGAIVTGPGSSRSYSDSAVINDVIQTIDEEEMLCTAFVLAGGQTVMLDTDAAFENVKWRTSGGFSYYDTEAPKDSDVKLDDLKRGDVIQYSLKNGKVNKIKLIVKADNIGPLRIDGDNIQRSGNMLTEIISVAENGRTALVRYSNSDGELLQSMIVNGTVYRYDSETDKIYNSSTADLRAGDKVLINSFWWSPRAVVIFR